MEGKAGFSYSQVQVIDGELILISYAERFRAAAEILGMQILSIDGLVIISYKHCRTGLFEMQHLGWISLPLWPVVCSDTPKVPKTARAVGSGFLHAPKSGSCLR